MPQEPHLRTSRPDSSADSLVAVKAQSVVGVFELFFQTFVDSRVDADSQRESAPAINGWSSVWCKRWGRRPVTWTFFACTAVCEMHAVSEEINGSILPRGHPVASEKELRRHHSRVNSPKDTFLAWQYGSKRFVSRLENLGLGGLFIRTPESSPHGTFIQLLLDTPLGEIRAHAVVQNVKPNEGIGVKIVGMQQEDRARFARWLKNLSS